MTRVNTNIVHNTYINNSFQKNVNVNRTSFNGPNGIKAQPNAEQRAAVANAKKVEPTSQQLSRQQAASKDQNLRASVNKGHPNNEAIKSFNKNEGAGQGKGAQGLEAAGGAAGAGAENKPGNLAERQDQGAAAGVGKTGNEPENVTNHNLKEADAGAGAGKPENNRANMAEHNRHGAGADNAGAGNGAANGNKLKTGNQGNRANMGGNQAKMHSGKMGGAGGHAGQPHTMNQMGGRNPQMGTR